MGLIPWRVNIHNIKSTKSRCARYSEKRDATRDSRWGSGSARIPTRDPRTCAARRSCCRARRPRPRRGGLTKRYRMAEQRAVCAAVPVRALLQLPLLGVERGYKGLYGGGWPLRGMGAAGTALGAADARTNEHYEIGTILTQFSHCESSSKSESTKSSTVSVAVPSSWLPAAAAASS